MFTCSGSVSVTQQDMDAGELSGSVTVTGMSPEGDVVPASSWANNTLSGISLVAIGQYYLRVATGTAPNSGTRCIGD